MKTDNSQTMNEPAAALAEASAPAPVRRADFKNLQKLLSRFDKLERVLGETESLNLRLEREIADTIGAGEEVSEELAKSLMVKRTQQELIPAKLTKLVNDRQAILGEIAAECTASMTELEKRFAGINDAVRRKIESFVKPLLIESFSNETAISMLVQNTLASAKVGQLLNPINFHLQMGRPADAARLLIKSEREAGEMAAAYGGKI